MTMVGTASTYLKVWATVSSTSSRTKAGSWFSPTRVAPPSSSGFKVRSLDERRATIPRWRWTPGADRSGAVTASSCASDRS